MTTDRKLVEEIEQVMRGVCYVYIRSVEGRGIDTESIACVEVHGIEESAKAIAALLSHDGGSPGPSPLAAIAASLEAKSAVETLRDVLHSADTAINPPDREGISLDKWNSRLKFATQEISDAIALADAFLAKGASPSGRSQPSPDNIQQEEVERQARIIFEHMTDIDGDEADWIYYRDMLCDGVRALASPSPPVQDMVGEEEIARALVPYAIGKFEDRKRNSEGKWDKPPLTPNDHAREAARAVLDLLRSRQEPGTDDLTFGSLLSEMIRRSFQCVDGSAGPEGRHYAECLHCQGNDAARLEGQRPSLELVIHAPDCLLAEHLPRIKAMANKGVS